MAKQKILIVDDDNNIAELISLYLMKECFDTLIVEDGEQALEQFGQFQPHLLHPHLFREQAGGPHHRHREVPAQPVRTVPPLTP